MKEFNDAWGTQCILWLILYQELCSSVSPVGLVDKGISYACGVVDNQHSFSNAQSDLGSLLTKLFVGQIKNIIWVVGI